MEAAWPRELDAELDELAAAVQHLADQPPTLAIATAAWRLLHHSRHLEAGRWPSATLVHLRARLRGITKRAPRGEPMLTQPAMLVPLIGNGAIHVSIPANTPPPAVLLWGERGSEHAYVLTGGQANPAGPLVYHEMSCKRLDSGLLADVRTVADIAEDLTL